MKSEQSEGVWRDKESGHCGGGDDGGSISCIENLISHNLEKMLFRGCNQNNLKKLLVGKMKLKKKKQLHFHCKRKNCYSSQPPVEGNLYA